MRRAALTVGLVMLSVAFVFGDYKDAFAPDIDSPPIEYGTRPTTDAVSQLNLQIQQGKVHLQFDDQQGYLRPVLEALDIPIQSQLVVFSKTSFQMYRISPSNPRSLYFNDSVAVGWVRGGPIVELAAEDPEQGVIFYTLDQKPAPQPQFVRHDDTCLACHESTAAVGVPGMLVRSVFPAPSGMPLEELGGHVTDDRSPFAQRWGGWYVTGMTGAMRHMGNGVVTDPSKAESISSNQTLNLESLKGKFDTDAYLSPYSDIVALMVFEHEMHMMNLFTRAGWEVRYSEYEDRTTDSPVDRLGTTEAVLREAANAVADAMLFVDEKALPDGIRGTSGFEEMFSAEGPRDSEGRSLRQFDLRKRLIRYPCSYMIYSPAFDALPADLKAAIYARLWVILSGREQTGKYAKLSLADRRAVVEILRDTKKDLPDYFQAPTS
ncbi:MAG: hypothetical protein ACLP3K_03550 [Candidatus Acidiferrales bacterium]